MKKRSVFVVVILLLLAVVIPTPSVSASTDATQIKKIIAMTGYLETDKIIEGKVTRAQFAQILYNLTADNPEIKQTVNVSLYSDVSKNHWAATYIKAAVKKGYMMGYLDGKFKPGNYITLQEAAYAMIKVLGYTDSDLSGNLSSAVMAIYKKAKLNTNILLEKDSKLSKNGCIYLIYNLLVAKNNAGVVYGTTKGFQMDDDGELDYLSLVETYTEGPVILSSDYTETFTSKKYTLVYKDDEKATIADLAKYDVVYYNDEIKTLWAYDTKVTGTVKEISPSKSKPTSITIGNTSYNLGTSEMKTKFSNLGSIDLGDTITILLGRDGEVVGTLSTDTYKVVQYGYVNDVSLNYVNDEDSLLAQIEISVTDFDGVNHVIVYDGNFSDFAEGNIVTMTYTSSGTQLNMATHYTETQKTISDDGKFIDYNEISNNVKIVEQTASGINAVSIDRLKGCILYSDDIYFSAYDENGELIEL